MTLDAALPPICGIVTLALVVVLASKRIFPLMPVFVVYQAYSVFFGLGMTALLCIGDSRVYFLFWGVGNAIDTLLYLCVVAEVRRNVLRYNRAAPLSRTILFGLFIVAVVPICLLAQWSGFLWRDRVLQIGLRVMQASAILEVAAILALAWWSNIKKLRWPEREFQVITGMGFWAMVQFCVLILHQNGLIGPGYHWLDFLTPLSVLAVLIYWLHFFWFHPGAAELRTTKASAFNRFGESSRPRSPYAGR